MATSLLFASSFYGIEGFDDLRKIVKHGGDLCRDIMVVLTERAACEAQYAKSLQKCGAKMSKLCSANVGTTYAAWETVADEMNSEAESHRKIGETLLDDICKPLKNMCENHSKVRKPIELTVDKATKSLSDKRQVEHKYKSKTFQLNQDTEKLHNTIIETRLSTTKKSPEKELVKMDKKLNSSKEAMRKSGKHYYSASLAAERSRQDWETATLKSAGQLQQLEEERLKELHKYLKLYKNALDNIAPHMASTCDRISEAMVCIDFEKDLRKMVESRTRGMNQPEQILFETYAEDLDAVMEKERRRQSLKLYLYYLSQDIQSEQKGIAGIERLADIYKQQPDYADYETMEETKLKARQMHAMINFLDASHYKLSVALSICAETDEPTYRFSSYMERTKDKSGLPLTLLKVPAHLISEGFNAADFTARGLADGSHDAPTDGTPYESISHDGEFSDGEEHYEDEFDYEPVSQKDVICTCRVLFDFNSTQSEELTIRTGDMVNVLEKHDDGWWKGEIRGAVGIFPETYVEEADVWHATEIGDVVILMPADEVDNFKEKVYADNLVASRDEFSVESLDSVDKIEDGWRRHKRSLSEFNLTAYNTYENVADYLDELGTTYSSLCKIIDIGTTFEGRALKLAKITGSAPVNRKKLKVYIDGCQHAREWLSPAVATMMITELIKRYEEGNGTIMNLLDKYEFHILPISNPDGYAFSYSDGGYRWWRKNRKIQSGTECIGVDLNRNWDLHWAGPGASTDPCNNVYQGLSGFSEEETKAASTYILNQQDWHSYFSIHSFGQMVLYPWSHNSSLSPDFSKHKEAGEKIAEGIKEAGNKTFVVGSVTMILYAAAGSSESWAYAKGGFPYAYTLELPDLRRFDVSTTYIQSTTVEILTGLIKYFKHIEENDPEVYLGTRWDDRNDSILSTDGVTNEIFNTNHEHAVRGTWKSHAVCQRIPLEFLVVFLLLNYLC